jgi:hypothetical protein
MSLAISITATQDGWTVQGDTIEQGMMFLSGADAEAAARSLAQRYSETGRTTEIEIFLRDGSLAGRYVTAPVLTAASDDAKAAGLFDDFAWV